MELHRTILERDEVLALAGADTRRHLEVILDAIYASITGPLTLGFLERGVLASGDKRLEKTVATLKEACARAIAKVKMDAETDASEADFADAKPVDEVADFGEFIDSARREALTHDNEVLCEISEEIWEYLLFLSTKIESSLQSGVELEFMDTAVHDLAGKLSNEDDVGIRFEDDVGYIFNIEDCLIRGRRVVIDICLVEEGLALSNKPHGIKPRMRALFTSSGSLTFTDNGSDYDLSDTYPRAASFLRDTDVSFKRQLDQHWVGFSIAVY